MTWTRNEAGRFTARTVLYAVVAAMLVGGAVTDTAERYGPWLLALSVVLYAAAVVAVARRVRRPWWVPVLSLLSVPVLGTGLTFVAVTSLAVRRRDRGSWAFVVAAFLAVFVPTLAGDIGVRITPGDDSVRVWEVVVAAVSHAVLLALAYLVGSVTGTRRDLLASLQDRAERAESERASRAREAVLLERARIAREMHDVLGHKISLVTMQAGALEVNAGAGAEVVEREATRIRLTAREALQDLRAVIGALESQDPAPLTPDQGVAQVPDLVTRTVEAGGRIRFEDTVTRHPCVGLVDASAGRAVHRVLTEALTNAHRHAPGEVVTVGLTGRPGEGVRLVVENPMPSVASPPDVGGGTGLTGLAERVRLAGGQFEAGPYGALWRVHARFPWPERAAGVGESPAALTDSPA